ncbi:hypothetical protein F5Y09DRAFT_297847 [Xylaria sp. FL1042]|nr:hypothetical protein F5Y09DRAFT_297847 [Xylaria sp. FL1042]
MEEIKDTDYRGIGEGLSITYYQDLSSGESTMSLNNDCRNPSLHQIPECESYSDTSTTGSSIDVELETKLGERSSTAFHETFAASSSKEQYLQSLSPFERYYSHLQAHEQLAVGQITNRQSLTRLIELDDSLCATARILPGCASRLSAPSSSNPSSTSGGDPDKMPTLDLPMKDLPELQAASQEERAERLRKIDKLRRRLKVEGGGRIRKSARVRKRSKAGENSNETGHRVK